MRLTALQYLIWYASTLGYATLAASILWRKSYKRWPFFLSLSLFQVASSLLLMRLTGPEHYHTYFYVYWYGAVVQAVLGFGILFDVVRAIPGIRYTPRVLALGFLAAATAITAGSAWMASSGGAQTFHVTMMVLALDRCIAIAWASFAVTIFWAISFCGFGWTETPLRLGSGFLALTLLEVANAYSMSMWPKRAFLIDEGTTVLNIALLIYFSLTIYCETTAEKVNVDSRVLEKLQAALTPTIVTANRER